ncbi:cell surface protein SprA [Croceibacter atlanticus]|uniref:T9SS outer membrane translocon Sov/SprA n=1 Tax=Croceibacter atlanticus TaxID=313588 RepID=UPI000C8EF5BB|nr:cell surface protein SprA [Croceibacter sp.]WSP34939.1 cell surface protein SprA [Croceibacter atlanticus]
MANFYFKIPALKTAILLFALLGAYSVTAQEETEQDSTSTGYSLGKIELSDPNSILNKYTYDVDLDRYVYTQKLGEFNISYPLILTPDEYQRLIFQEEMRKYFNEKSDALSGKKEGTEEEQKNLLPNFYVNNNFFESVFGGREIEVIPTGTVEVDLGVLYTKQDNPSFSPRNRSNLTFDFDQRISLSLLGKVGKRLQVTANYDTEASFDFQNQIKLEYTPTEDDIVRKIEIGNVSLPLNSSLIQGAQSLFGAKVEMQFGKTTITGVYSEQNSERNTVNVEGGDAVQDFEKFILDYDENKHFFLSHYFRDTYDRSLVNYPFINSNVQITRIQVWVTNRTNNTQSLVDARNIVAIQDIGESDQNNIGLDNQPAGFVNEAPGSFPDNENNDFNPFGIGNPQQQSILNNQIRDVATIGQGFGTQVTEGRDYGVLENARQLQNNEYTINTQLGYISLNQRLSNDEILGVAFQYTVGGQVFQVGEFANDGVEATASNPDTDLDGILDSVDADVDGDGTNDNGQDTDGDGINDASDVDQTNGQDANNDGIDDAALPPNMSAIVNQTLVVKMLKSPITNVNEPIWDLMMKNIYSLDAFDVSAEDFRFNILYTDPQPLNYIQSVGADPLPDDVEQTTLLRVLNLDKLNAYNDPVLEGDGFFDYVPGLTIDPQNGRIIFTSTEPFGEYLFNKLRLNPSEDYDDEMDGSDNELLTYNSNQREYVFKKLYTTTKIQAEQESAEKNKFQLKGRYKSSGVDGIPIGGFNIPQGSVTVTAGGRVLQEGVDYVVNYQFGRVQILDESLLASDVPIQISTESNALFGQQTKRFTGLNVEHRFNENFLIGGTYLNLNERPITQKANYGYEPINNSIYGFNINYSTELPWLTRFANHLPNIDTEVESNFSIRGEFAYLQPGSPSGDNFRGETVTYVDDFEASQTSISILTPLSWELSSVPTGPNGFDGGFGNGDLRVNDRRARINWYTVDPIFYSNQRPDGVSDADLSDYKTRRVFIDEIFPETTIVQGQPQVLFPMDIAFYPEERGQYNYATGANGTNTLPNPEQNFGGITRQITNTNFEQSNVEYIEFWLLDPFIYDENAGSTGGTISFNLGSISEDVLKDGRKQYENGLPEDGGTAQTQSTAFGKVPQNQSLVYAFDTEGQARVNQDVGFDGLDDAEEASRFGDFAGLADPSNDNYNYFLNAQGSITERYRQYNGTQGNSPTDVSQDNRGNTTFPTVEDVNRDNTMNTIDSYLQLNVPIAPNQMSPDTNEFVTDVRELDVNTVDGGTLPTRWVQFRVPLQFPQDSNDPLREVVGGIGDLRSVRFMRMFLQDFQENIHLRFATLDLVRGDYRRYNVAIQPDGNNPTTDDALFEVTSVSEEMTSNYEPPPGVIREEFVNNNQSVLEDEQSLALTVSGLKPNDSRAVYKNFQVDMRQYEKLQMFLHAESLPNETPLEDDEMVAFIRMGLDFTDNFYQVEIPLKVTAPNATNAAEIWPSENELQLPLDLLQTVKATVLGSDQFAQTDLNFFNENGEVSLDNVPGELRVGIKGNPSFGNVRVIMLGVKNTNDNNLDETSGQVWFNELRLSGLKNEGGWAAVVNMDANVADFMNVSATGRRSTVGFGSIEQGPNQRSREDVQSYDVTTNVSVGQLLPKNWGVQIPFNYTRGEELITPQYDPEFLDLELDDRIDAAQDSQTADAIKERAEDYTRRQSVSIIGLRKNRVVSTEPGAEPKTPMPYDIENFTLSGTYNQTDHRDFEIEESIDQNVRVGATYEYAVPEVTIEPFKKIAVLDSSAYFKPIKDFNFNPLPTSISLGSNIQRQYNRQRFRSFLGEGNIIPQLYQRNYLYDWQFALNWKLSKSLNFNYTTGNNFVVRNYVNDDLTQDQTIGLWDGFFETGTPNIHTQNLQLNYELPLNKIPLLEFVKSTYSYESSYQWQRGSEIFNNLQDQGIPRLGNTVQNSMKHELNSTLDLQRLYNYVGLKKKQKKTTARRTSTNRRDLRQGQTSTPRLAAQGNQDNTPSNKLSGADKAINTGIGLLTAVKKLQVSYIERQGTFLPGYTPTVGFIGSVRPTVGFTLGSQRDVREEAARRGWLTLYDQFNQQYQEVENRELNIQATVDLLPDLKIDLNAARNYSETFQENYRVTGSGIGDYQYNSLTPNTFGNFSISTVLIATAFSQSDQDSSEAFDTFRENRLVVARRLAAQNGQDPTDVDENGFPSGYGRGNQAVLLPAFLSAYSGKDVNSVSLGAFRDTPLPNWTIKYTGLMRLKWFKDNFKRFSLNHAYNSVYTLSQFQTNIDFDTNNPFGDNNRDQAGNFKNRTLFSNVNITEAFSPLVKIDMETNNSIKILAEIRKDRALSLSFDNNLLTEISGNEYIVGLGYRIKDLKIATRVAGKRRILSSDLNFKADISYRRNKTIIRYLDLDNSQTTAGQNIWTINFTTDYALTKNLTALFYYDHSFSTYEISTAFPQTTIRGGITLRYNFGN